MNIRREPVYLYPCKPQFNYIKVGDRRSALHGHVSMMCSSIGNLYKTTNERLVYFLFIGILRPAKLISPISKPVSHKVERNRERLGKEHINTQTGLGWPHMSRVLRKSAFCIYMRKTKTQTQLKLISAFVFATRIVQYLYFLNPKFQASSHLLWSCSLVCVGPGRKPRRPVFSQRGSHLPRRNIQDSVLFVCVLKCEVEKRCMQTGPSDQYLLQFQTTNQKKKSYSV